MQRNPDETRLKILDRSGLLFNAQGYKATSISDITRATGYTKGAIYRHFRNKDALEKETLQHLSSKMFTILRGRIKSAETAGEKLRSIVTYFETYITRPGVKGGCPLMNAAIEADDAHPVLRRTAVRILDTLHSSVTHILNNGIRFKQIKKNIDVDFYATIIIASLEGAIMMSKLRGDNRDINRVILHLEDIIRSIET